MKLHSDVVTFLEHQGFVIVSTLDDDGSIHCAAKGLAGIDEDGDVLIVDLYRGGTFNNLLKHHQITITSVDEHKFCGYTLKGTARMVEREKIADKIIAAWEARVIKRVTKRLITHIKGEKKSTHHPEVILPKPEYLIVMKVKDVVNLTPHHMRKK